MQVDLDKKDLVRLIKGCEPNYCFHRILTLLDLGMYHGGFNDEWSWNNRGLLKLSEQQIFIMYNIINSEDEEHETVGELYKLFDLNKAPKYVALNNDLTCCLILDIDENSYYRHGGHWSIKFKWENGILKSYDDLFKESDGIPLVECTEEEWKKSNKGYI